jgi:hypothetical protein
MGGVEFDFQPRADGANPMIPFFTPLLKRLVRDVFDEQLSFVFGEPDPSYPAVFRRTL